MKSLRLLAIATIALTAVCAIHAQTWTPVQNVPNIGAGAIALLTDGRVLVHDESGNSTPNWYTLTPDINGNYATGTWAQVASTPIHLCAAVLRLGGSARRPLYHGRWRIQPWPPESRHRRLHLRPGSQHLDQRSSAHRMELYRRLA